MEAIPSSENTEIIFYQATAGHRYRVVRTDLGYLITARSRDGIGLALPEQWLHKRRETALACAEAAIAAHTMEACRLTGHFEGAAAAFEKASSIHTALCEKMDDQPVIGHKVQQLRDRLQPLDEP
jgi:hypothetical protein